MEIKNRRLNIRIDKAMFKWLKQVAKERKITYSTLARDILEKERERHDHTQENDRGNA